VSRLALAPYYGKRVKVYRNLRAGKANGFKTYSVLHEGRVVAHVGEIMLSEATFVVRKGGQKRVREQRRKNVHAFVVGTVVRSGMGIEADGKLPAVVTYNPYKDDHFMAAVGPTVYPIESAMTAVINQHGVSAAYTTEVGR